MQVNVLFMGNYCPNKLSFCIYPSSQTLNPLDFFEASGREWATLGLFVTSPLKHLRTIAANPCHLAHDCYISNTYHQTSLECRKGYVPVSKTLSLSQRIARKQHNYGGMLCKPVHTIDCYLTRTRPARKTSPLHLRRRPHLRLPRRRQAINRPHVSPFPLPLQHPNPCPPPSHVHLSGLPRYFSPVLCNHGRSDLTKAPASNPTPSPNRPASSAGSRTTSGSARPLWIRVSP